VAAGWIGLEFFVGTGKRNVRRMLKIEMEFGRKYLGWREDRENGEGTRAQSGFVVTEVSQSVRAWAD